MKLNKRNTKFVISYIKACELGQLKTIKNMITSQIAMLETLKELEENQDEKT